MKSFALAASGLRHALAAQGLTPRVKGDKTTVPAPPVLECARHIGRIVRTQEQAAAWVRRWHRDGHRVAVSALRSGFLIYVRVA